MAAGRGSSGRIHVRVTHPFLTDQVKQSLENGEWRWPLVWTTPPPLGRRLSLLLHRSSACFSACLFACLVRVRCAYEPLLLASFLVFTTLYGFPVVALGCERWRAVERCLRADVMCLCVLCVRSFFRQLNHTYLTFSSSLSLSLSLTDSDVCAWLVAHFASHRVRELMCCFSPYADTAAIWPNKPLTHVEQPSFCLASLAAAVHVCAADEPLGREEN